MFETIFSESKLLEQAITEPRWKKKNKFYSDKHTTEYILECMTIRSHPLRTKVYSPACQIAAPPDYKISISRQVSCHIDHIDKLLTEKDGTGICFVFCASNVTDLFE